MKQDMIVILDLGSTENTVLAREIRELGVYSEIHPHDITEEEIKAGITGQQHVERMINQITVMFPLDTYNDNSPLSSEFLHAYSCQMNDFFTKKTDDNKEEE